METEEEKSKAQAEEKEQGDRKSKKTPSFSPIKTDTVQAYLRVGEKSVLIGECCIPRSRKKQIISLTMEIGKRNGRILKCGSANKPSMLWYSDRKKLKKKAKWLKQKKAIKGKPIPSLPQHVD